MDELQTTPAAHNDAAAPATAAVDAVCPSPREETAMGNEDFVPSAAPRPSIFVRAASFASRASRVTVFSRSKGQEKPIEETESEDSVQSESERDASQSNASEVVETPDAPVTPAISAIATLLLPWQTRNENGDAVDDPAVRQKILELTVLRTTYTEHPGGEEAFVFDYVKYSDLAKVLLLHDPSLREMHGLLVPLVVDEIPFWRNFFLRCNAVRLALDRSPFLPQTKATVFRKFKRGLSLRTDRMRRTMTLRSRNTSFDAVDALDIELGEWDLDLDGEIDRELRMRRPSRVGALPGA